MLAGIFIQMCKYLNFSFQYGYCLSDYLNSHHAGLHNSRRRVPSSVLFTKALPEQILGICRWFTFGYQGMESKRWSLVIPPPQPDGPWAVSCYPFCIYQVRRPLYPTLYCSLTRFGYPTGLATVL